MTGPAATDAELVCGGLLMALFAVLAFMAGLAFGRYSAGDGLEYLDDNVDESED